MKSVFRLCVWLLFLSAGLLWVSHLVMKSSVVQALSQGIQRYHLLLCLWRYGMYAIVLMLWPYFIKLIAIRQKWPIQITRYLSNQRLKLLGLFVLVEVLLVNNVLGYLIGLS